MIPLISQAHQWLFLFAADSSDTAEKVADSIVRQQVTRGDIVIAIAIFVASIVGGIVAGRVLRLFLRRLEISKTAANTFSRIAKYTIIVFGFLSGVSYLGVETGWLALFVIVVGFVIYVASKPLLENIGAGLLIITRPAFKIGSDVTIDENTGTVIDINARSTVIQTRDNHRIHIPNQQVLEEELIVFDAFETRRSQIKLTINDTHPIDFVEKTLIDATSRADGVVDKPAPSIRFKDISTGSYTVALRWWHKSSLQAESQTRDHVIRNLVVACKKAHITFSSDYAIDIQEV